MICPMADLSIPAAVANTSTAIISPTSYAELPIMSRTAECNKIWKPSYSELIEQETELSRDYFGLI